MKDSILVDETEQDLHDACELLLIQTLFIERLCLPLEEQRVQCQLMDKVHRFVAQRQLRSGCAVVQ